MSRGTCHVGANAFAFPIESSSLYRPPSLAFSTFNYQPIALHSIEKVLHTSPFIANKRRSNTVQSGTKAQGITVVVVNTFS